MNRAVTLAAQNPYWSYHTYTRIVAPTLKDAIAHARACNEMWHQAFVLVSDEETDEPVTDVGEWPRGKFDMLAHKGSVDKLRVIPAVRKVA